ncbi:DUF6531 domain-containing protein [Pontibacter chitinilyticus]|uniref:DUF6531 domain-containing protein n=1 Tax=Pontibacter chitinilyticus TaxID=2674989 RepID=UPI00321C0E16
MAGKYIFKLYESSKGFDYGGKHYNPGDEYGPVDACQMKGFLNASQAANPGAGINAKKNTMAQLDEECKATTNNTTPQPDTGTSPSEVSPATPEGDSANKQGAPAPKVAGGMEPDSAESGSKQNPPPTEEPTRPTDGEANKTHGGEQPQVKTNAGDPVDLFTGAFYMQETDMEIPHTLMLLAFTRLYRSGAAAYGPFGWNWDHNYNLYVRELNDGSIALWRNLHEAIFKFDGTNYEPPNGIFERLTPVTGLIQAYDLTGEGGTVTRFERPSGWLDAERIPVKNIQDRHGNILAFTYGAEDKLAEVRDEDDRFFRFRYDACGLLVEVTDNAGRKFLYEHDEQTMQLTHVTSPPITDHPEGITKIYHYEQPYALPELRHNIISVEDALGNVYLENKYEQDPASWSYARITEQLYGGFLYQFRYTQLQWVPESALFMNIPAVRVEVLNPDFSLETYTFNYRGDLLDRRFRLNKDNSFRVATFQYEFDLQGNLAITTKPDGSQEINTYDFSNADPCMRGRLLQKELTSASGFPAPSRIIWQGKYEPLYQLLTEEKNEANAVTRYKYDFDIAPAAPDNSGKLAEIIAPDVTLPDGSLQKSTTKYEYYSNGQVKAIIQPDGVRQEMVYGSTGNTKNRLIKATLDAGGLNIIQEIGYNVFGFEAEKTDSNGNLTKRIINALGLAEQTVLPAVNGSSAESVLHYNTDRKIVGIERPKGSFTDPLVTGSKIIDTYERDVLGYPIKFYESSNTSEKRISAIRCDFRGMPEETINPDGSRLIRSYDERGLLIREVIKGKDGAELVTRKVYDRNGKLAQETDASGAIMKYEYDGFGRISKVTRPNQTEIWYKWAKGDLPESEEVRGADGFGSRRQLSKKSYTYDEKYRKITETIQAFSEDPSTAVSISTAFFYDKLDRIEKIEDSRGGTKTLKYDGPGRLIAETDPMGNETHYMYDNNGNRIRTESHDIEPDGTVSIITKKYRYDERNRQTELVEPDGAKIITEYDDRDLVVRQTDYLGLVKEIHYNSFGDRQQEVYDAGGLAITHRWIVDVMSRPTAYVDPSGQVSAYFYDSVGHNNKTTYPNGFSSLRTFNDKGQIIKEQLGSGVAFEYTYDAANRLISINNTVVPASVVALPQHQFMYDGLDRVVTAKAGTEEIVRKYDSRGRLTAETTLGSTIQCRYSDKTGVVEKEFMDGRTEVYTHNLNGVVSKIEETLHGTLGSGGNILAAFTPSGAVCIGETALQGNLKISNKYDERKRLTELTLRSPAGMQEQTEYRYDKANRRKVEALLGQQPVNKYFEFDSKYRLIVAKGHFSATVSAAHTQAEHDMAVASVKAAATTATHTEAYAYNLADARLKYTETGSIDKNYTYLPGHRIQSDGVHTYTYTGDGAVQSDGVLTFSTDALGRVATIRSGVNLLCSITYDAFNRPSMIAESGKPVRSFNYLGAFVAQENENGTVTRQITSHPASGVPVAYHTAAKTHYTLIDGRYNLIGLADINGNLVEAYRYDAFGKPSILNPAGALLSSSAFGVEPLFGGQRYLASTGLYLSKRRLMNPADGIFLSPDPNGYEDAASLYVYAAQNPDDRIDPTGEVVPLIVAVFVIGGALLGAGYSVYDATQQPEKYEGTAGITRPLAQTFGGAAIGGVSVVGGEAVLAYGGTGIFATGSGAVTTLTATETFVMYGTSSAVAGGIGRYGFNGMFPEYIDPVSNETIATDYLIGGGIPVVGSGLKYVGTPLIEGAGQIFNRALGGNWRAFGNTGEMLLNPRIQYDWTKVFWNPGKFSNVSKQYWRVSGGADGKALHHLWFQNQSTWVPQGLRNAGFNLLEIPGPLNTWMGGRFGREFAFRGIIGSILAGTGIGSYKLGSALLNSGDNEAVTVPLQSK